MGRYTLGKTNFREISFSLLLLITILTACEVSLDENFVDIPPPVMTDVVIDLDALMEEESIIIYKEKTQLKYSLQAFGKEVIYVHISFNERTRTSDEETGYIYTDPFSLPDGEYVMQFKYYIKSSNGSIADQNGLEYFEGMKEWRVKVCYELPPSQIEEIETSVNSDGFLELRWEKPSYKYLAFISYSIYENADLIHTITNPDEVSFSHRAHVFDSEQCFRVIANFEDNTNWDIASKTMPGGGFILERDYQNDTKEMVAVKWSNKYKCKWNIYINDVLKESDTTTGSLSLPITKFGADAWYNQHEVKVEPIAYYMNDRKTRPLSKLIYVGSPGVRISTEYLKPAYSLVEDAIYYIANDTLYCRTLPDFKIYSSISIGRSEIYTAEKNPKVLLRRNNELQLYSGKELKLLGTYQLNTGENILNVALLNDGNTFFATMRTEGARTIHYGVILDKNLKSKKRFLLQDEYYVYNNIMSSDSKYLCSYSASNLYISELSPDFEIIEQKSYQPDEGIIRELGYLPDNSSQIILGFEQYSAEPFKLQMYNTEDFSLLKEFRRGLVYENIDTKYNLMCASHSYDLIVMNYETQEELFSVPKADVRACMFGGILICTSGYAYDINKYLK